MEKKGGESRGEVRRGGRGDRRADGKGRGDRRREKEVDRENLSRERGRKEVTEARKKTNKERRGEKES